MNEEYKDLTEMNPEELYDYSRSIINDPNASRLTNACNPIPNFEISTHFSNEQKFEEFDRKLGVRHKEISLPWNEN